MKSTEVVDAGAVVVVVVVVFWGAEIPTHAVISIRKADIC